MWCALRTRATWVVGRRASLLRSSKSRKCAGRNRQSARDVRAVSFARLRGERKERKEKVCVRVYTYTPVGSTCARCCAAYLYSWPRAVEFFRSRRRSRGERPGCRFQKYGRTPVNERGGTHVGLPFASPLLAPRLLYFTPACLNSTFYNAHYSLIILFISTYYVESIKKTFIKCHYQHVQKTF